MKNLLMAGATALSLISGTAFAQTASETTTTQTVPYGAPGTLVVVPPAGVLSTTRSTSAVDAYGNKIDQQSTTYRNSQGMAQDSQTTTQTVTPLPPVATTTTTDTTTTLHN